MTDDDRELRRAAREWHAREGEKYQERMRAKSRSLAFVRLGLCVALLATGAALVLGDAWQVAAIVGTLAGMFLVVGALAWFLRRVAP